MYQFAINNLNGAYSAWGTTKVVKRSGISYRRDCALFEWGTDNIPFTAALPLALKGYLQFSMSVGNINCPQINFYQPQHVYALQVLDDCTS